MKWKVNGALAAVLLVSLSGVSQVRAQQEQPDAQGLARRVEELEKQLLQTRDALASVKTELARIHGKSDGTAGQSSVPSQANAVVPPAAEVPPQAVPSPIQNNHELYGGLTWRAFVTSEYEYAGADGGKGKFFPGDFTLLLTDKISDKWRGLAEIDFRANANFETSSDVERVQLSYHHSDSLDITLGRYQSDLSYYNTAYNHGRWLSTISDRPRIVEFADDGGILPMRRTGVSIKGAVPGTDAAGLHYYAELGSAPDMLTNLTGGSAGFYIKPAALNGFRTGFSYTHQKMSLPGLLGGTRQDIYGTHVIFKNQRNELVSEGFYIREVVPTGALRYNGTGFYALVSRGFEKWRPYFLYQYINMPESEPVYPALFEQGISRDNGPAFGLRYDLADYLALKLQYMREFKRDNTPANNFFVHLDWVF